MKKHPFLTFVILVGIVVPVIIGVLIGVTPNTVLRTGDAGQFVTSTASAGGFLSSSVTSVQTSVGTIAVYGAFSAVHGQSLVIHDTLKEGSQLCVRMMPETCVGLAGPWPAKLVTVPQLQLPVFASLVTHIGSKVVAPWLFFGALICLAGILIAATKSSDGKRDPGDAEDSIENGG